MCQEAELQGLACRLGGQAWEWRQQRREEQAKALDRELATMVQLRQEEERPEPRPSLIWVLVRAIAWREIKAVCGEDAVFDKFSPHPGSLGIVEVLPWSPLSPTHCGRLTPRRNPCLPRGSRFSRYSSLGQPDLLSRVDGKMVFWLETCMFSELGTQGEGLWP